MSFLGVSTPAQAHTLAGDLFRSEFFRYDVYDEQDKKLPRDQRQPVIDASSAALKRVIAESRRFVQ